MPKIAEILNILKPISFTGNIEQEVHYPIILDAENKNPFAFMWVNDKNLEKLKTIEAGSILCSNNIDFKVSENINLIQVENPRNAFRIVLEHFFNPKKTASISNTAIIHESVKIGTNAFIGEHVVIEQGCEIGDNVEINHNTVIYHQTIIGNDVKIGANNSIGGIGFGYEKDLDGTYVLIPHLGNVVIEDLVHIGNNNAIDRAVLGSTLLQKNVKIDNLVHIAHGVNIGQNSLVIANAMIAGSCVIGKNVWVAPSSSILNKINVDDDSVVGMGAVVVKKVNAFETVVGNPAKPLHSE
jgi:UDP-3-O-[3-hydroxymyristoyl] glucosamine N-acyltransferase